MLLDSSKKDPRRPRAPRSSGDVRLRPFLPLIGHTSACAVLGCAFVIVSASRVWEVVRVTPPGPILPYHTTNSYLVNLLKVDNGSERLLGLLRASAEAPDRGRPA